MNNFHEMLPVSRIISTLSIIDVVVLKTFGNDIENIFEKVHDWRQNVLYMISFESFVKGEKDN